MNLRSTFRLLCIALVFSSCGETQNTDSDSSEQTEKGDEWKMLFDGQTTNGWSSVTGEAVSETGWKVQNGMLMGSGAGGDILTTEQYGDFELEWEWKMLTSGGNSGVKYFVKEYQSGNDKHWLGLEYQILDDENFSWMKDGRMKPGDFRTLAALYEIYPAENRTAKPVGEWNTSRIVSRGSHAEHWLNGAMVLQYERGGDDFRARVRESKFAPHENFGESREGHILIQDHGSEMAFRNIRIREFKDSSKSAER